jgi:hypothetical protein
MREGKDARHQHPPPEELSMTSSQHDTAQSLSTVRDLLARLDPQRVEPCGVPGCLHLAPNVAYHDGEGLMAA